MRRGAIHVLDEPVADAVSRRFRGARNALPPARGSRKTRRIIFTEKGEFKLKLAYRLRNWRAGSVFAVPSGCRFWALSFRKLVRRARSRRDFWARSCVLSHADLNGRLRALPPDFWHSVAKDTLSASIAKTIRLLACCPHFPPAASSLTRHLFGEWAIAALPIHRHAGRNLEGSIVSERYAAPSHQHRSVSRIEVRPWRSLYQANMGL